jgi:uncharacterized cupin superfamily protein
LTPSGLPDYFSQGNLTISDFGEHAMNKIVGEEIQLGQLKVTFLAKGQDTGGHADVYEVTVAPGAKVPGAHFHVDVDEVICGLEGVMTYVVGETVHQVGPGDRVLSPRGVVHHFSNKGDVQARTLIIATPARMGPEYFRDIAAVMKNPGPPDLQQIFTVMRRYGLEPAPLPAAVAPRA